MTLFRIANGTVHDPANGIDGEVRDVWIDNGRVIESPVDSSRRADRTLDATGLVVMPGGVDMHCHIAGSKVNTARKMMPENQRDGEPMLRTALTRSGNICTVPSTFTTGYLYAGLGYTTAFDAAVPPLSAQHAHEELQDTPIIDKGFYTLMGNNHYVMKQLQANEPERLKAYIAWLLTVTKSYAPKIVNAGGVEVWKSSGLRSGNSLTGIDDLVGGFGVSARQIIRGIARAANELRLPHAVHIHCNQLGMPGNWATTLETMRALEGDRGHLTHVQFHSYGGDADEQSTFCSQVEPLAAYVNSHSNITVDVGQVLFGETVSMTGDGALGHFLHKVVGRKWFGADVEMEAGCGIVPITYKEKSVVHALQWAIGLEWYLLVDDPWQIAMSTDHPNGAAFLAYPEIIALLMDRSRRETLLNCVPKRVREQCLLGDLQREYSLNEIAIITRAAPARILGLTQKGHLGAGADADITLYQPQDDLQTMFELPRYVIRAGEIIVDDGEIRQLHDGQLLHVAPEYDDGHLPDIQNWFEDNYSIQFRNYPVTAHGVNDNEQIVPVND